MISVRLGPVSSAGTFSWFIDGSQRPVAHNDIYVADLDGDGLEELIFAGFETQPNTPEEFSNISVRIFGWSGGKLKDLTETWMPGAINNVEGVGDVSFGDFNGDGRQDVFFSAYADMDHAVNAYQFLNKGGFFERQSLGFAQWQHGSASADINGDGFSDIVVAGYGYSFEHQGQILFSPGIYLGGTNGLTPITDSFIPGSGIALGDFSGNGSVSAIVVDTGSGLDDTKLFSFGSSGNFSLELISTLPRPRLEGREFGLTDDPMGQSHDVRARSLDFNGDGLVDVVVFSRMNFKDGIWPEVSQVQFLRNEGKGVFVDVTESHLTGYNKNTNAPYSPQFGDFNKDGFLDLFVSASSFGPVHDSTAMFAGGQGGVFKNLGGVFSSKVDAFGGNGALARGPEGKYFFVTNKFSVFSGEPGGAKSTISFREVVFGKSKSKALSDFHKDVIVGGPENDSLNGGLGNDVLTGGGGADVFVIDTALGKKNIDLITDFKSTDGDKIRLDSKIFSKFSGLSVDDGNLVIGANKKGAKAFDVDDFLILDRSKGALFYDADGSGKGKPVQFATLVGVTSLTAADFEVV